MYGKSELRDASHLWGKDTVATEQILRDDLGDKSVKVACIGPSGEALSLISCVINERGRAFDMKSSKATHTVFDLPNG